MVVWKVERKYLGLDGFELKAMNEKESSVACQNDQQISKVSEEYLNDQKTCDHLEVMNQSQSFPGILAKK